MLYLVQNYLVPAYFILVSGLTSRNVKTLVRIRIRWFLAYTNGYMSLLKVIRKFFLNHNKSFRWHLGDYEKHDFFPFEGL